MRILAEAFNGKCLSTDYTNNKTKLSWECENGHQFEKSSVEIKKGVWCPKCKKLPTTLAKTYG
jgi:hypothetical protein